MISFIEEPGKADFCPQAEPAVLVLSDKYSLEVPDIGYPFTGLWSKRHRIGVGAAELFRLAYSRLLGGNIDAAERHAEPPDDHDKEQEGQNQHDHTRYFVAYDWR